MYFKNLIFFKKKFEQQEILFKVDYYMLILKLYKYNTMN